MNACSGGPASGHWAGLSFPEHSFEKEREEDSLIVALPGLVMYLCVLLLVCAVESLTSFQAWFVAGRSCPRPQGRCPGFSQTCFSVKVFCRRCVVGEEGEALQKL